jgi:hypothetical protein
MSDTEDFFYPNGYNPVTFSNLDNVFPEQPKRINTNTARYALTNLSFAKRIKSLAGDGDIIEFGVCSGNSITTIAKYNPDRKVFGFDHFKGLEKTFQPTPDYSGWESGAFRLNDPNSPWIPKSVEEVLQKCSKFPNISIFVEDVHEMRKPEDYGIGKIGAVHIDVDIYEPTVSALNFLNRCDWEELYFRFDDWHGHEPDYDFHERKAFREWLDFNEYKYEIYENGLCGGAKVWRKKR